MGYSRQEERGLHQIYALIVILEVPADPDITKVGDTDTFIPERELYRHIAILNQLKPVIARLCKAIP
jgi:hypothetical protein